MSDSAWQMVCVCVYNFVLPAANRVLSLGKCICALCSVPEAIQDSRQSPEEPVGELSLRREETD